MKSFTVTPGTIKQRDCAIGNAGEIMYCLTEDDKGAVWVGNHPHDASVAAKEGTIYKIEKEKITATVTLPFQNFSKGASLNHIQCHSLLRIDNYLWAIDFEYGSLYRCDVNNASINLTAEIVYPAATTSVNPDEQYWEIAYQPACAALNNKNVIWVSECKKGKIYAFDANYISGKDALLHELSIADTDISCARDVIYDAANKGIWVLNTNPFDTTQNKLLFMSTKDNGKFPITAFAAPNALSLTSDESTLYVGHDSGDIKIYDLSKGITGALKLLVNLDKAPISTLQVDSAGYLWATAGKTAGMLYEVDPKGVLIGEYLINKGTKEEVRPYKFLWQESTDSLFIADDSSNARLVIVSPNQALGEYELHGQPDTGSTTPSQKFAPFNVVASDVVTKIALDQPVEAVLRVSELNKAGFNVTLDEKKSLTVAAKTGTRVEDLYAGKNIGQFTLLSRGGFYRPLKVI